MAELLINCVSGEQKIIKIEDSGYYFDDSRVLWDTRKDGEIPGSLTLGKMTRSKGKLVEGKNYLPEHAAWMAKDQQELEIKTKKASLEAEVKNDSDISLLRDMSGSQIDDWFVANVKTNADATKLLKKVIKTLIRKDVL